MDLLFQEKIAFSILEYGPINSEKKRKIKSTKEEV
jgi:hypothetical protein